MEAWLAELALLDEERLLEHCERLPDFDPATGVVGPMI